MSWWSGRELNQNGGNEFVCSSDDDGVEGENMGKQMVCVLTGRPWQFTSEREDTIKIDVRD
jgi:hypothetical protein